MRGSPDYFGSPTFPKYGGLRLHSTDMTEIAAGDTDSLFILNFKGVIMGGSILLEAEDNMPSAILCIRVDVEDEYQMGISFLQQHDIFVPSVNLVYLVEWNVQNSRILLALTPGITVDSRLHVRVYNNLAFEITVGTNTWYTDIK